MLLSDRTAWDETKDDFIARYAFRNDGRATERAVAFIEELVGD